jgi:hypothetical protein
MQAKDRYPALFEFLAAWFAEADFERRDDAALIAAYRSVPDLKARAAVLREGRAFLASSKPPWRAAALAANRRFGSARHFSEWLKGVLDAIER